MHMKVHKRVAHIVPLPKSNYINDLIADPSQKEAITVKIYEPGGSQDCKEPTLVPPSD